MPLTNEQLHEIRGIIRDHHQAFIINTIGIDSVAPEIVKQLQAKGLINIDVKSIQDAYLYGQVMAIADDPKLAKMNYAEFKEYVQKNPIPLTQEEQLAVRFAEQQAAQYVVGLGNRVDQQTGQLMIEADAQLRAETRGMIRDATATNIAKRESIKKLKSNLGWASKDWARDWDRIAVTEKHTSMQRGLADSLAERFGSDVRVAKVPSPAACAKCKALHLGPDGQPRIFKLSTLEANGLNNFGRKAADWLPVIGSVHPWCACQTVRVPAGWGFDETGSLVPGGEYGVAYESEGEFQKAFAAEQYLQKAYALQGHLTFQGLDIAIENKVGSKRHWKDSEGNSGTTEMLNAYGFIKRTMGADEDEIDVFMGTDPKAEMAFIIEQQNPSTGTYDEAKCMLGFSSAEHARTAYQAHYDRPDFYVTMTPMRMDQFIRWVGITDGDSAFKQGRPTDTFVVMEKAGPFIGPKGGKWADAKHTIPWKEGGIRTGLIKVSDAQVREVTDKILENVEANRHGVIVKTVPGYTTTKIKTPNGKTVDVTVFYTPREDVKDVRGISGSARTVVHAGIGKEEPSVDSTTIRIFAKPTAGMRDMDTLKGLVRSVLSHEMTHAADPSIIERSLGIAARAKSLDDISRADMKLTQTRTRKEYLNLPTEVTARMQQMARDILAPSTVAEVQDAWDSHREDPEEMPPPYKPDEVLSWSPTWKLIEKELTVKNRKRVLKLAARLVEGIQSRSIEGIAKSLEGLFHEDTLQKSMADVLYKAQTLRELGSTGNIPNYIAAVGSMAGNRAPGPGTVINHLVNSKRIAPATVQDLKPSPREHVEAQKHDRDRGQGQSRDRELMVFGEPLDKPAERFVIPDREPYKIDMEPEEIEANREGVDRELREKQGAKNTVEIGKSGTTFLLTEEQIQKASASVTPIGGITPGGYKKTGPNQYEKVGPPSKTKKPPVHPPGSVTQMHIVQGTMKRKGDLKIAHPEEMQKPPVHDKYMHAGHNVIISRKGKDPHPGKLVGLNYEGRPVVQIGAKRKTLQWTEVKAAEGNEIVATYEKLSKSDAMVHASPRQKKLVSQVLKFEVGKGKPAQEYSDWLRTRGVEVYLVGGIVRDLLAGTSPGVEKTDASVLESMKDIDIVTTAHPATGLQMASSFGHDINSKKEVRNSSLWGVVQIHDGVGLDFASIMSPDISGSEKGHFVFDHDLEKDAERRDFTANTLSYDVYNDVIVDPTGQGIADAQAKVLRVAPSTEAEARKNKSLPLRFWKFRARGWRTEAKTLALMKDMLTTAGYQEIGSGLKKALSKGTTTVARQKIWNQIKHAMVADGAKDLYYKYMKPHKKKLLEWKAP